MQEYGVEYGVQYVVIILRFNTVLYILVLDTTIANLQVSDNDTIIYRI